MKLGTRGSQLALWQARTVARLIEEAGGPACEIVVIRTAGDEAGTGLGPGGSTLPAGDPGAPIAAAVPPPAAAPSGKSLFVKELEEALLDGRIDFAVHSSKDMPALLPDGMTIGAVLPREDPRDAVVLPSGASPVADPAALAAALGPAARIGTSSVRRVAQLRHLLAGATFAGIRGNLDTRLRKLDAGACDAIVLASAGLRRLGHGDRISLAVPTDVCTPAPGQGIIAIEHAAGRDDVAAALGPINAADAADALAAERAVVRALGGGCQMPIGAIARIEGADLAIAGVVIAPDASRVVRHEARGPRRDAAAVGERLAAALLAGGAGEILEGVRNSGT
ncbi:MAG: hydroxymethylbilane synthase [Vicinamibacterales bacterium]